MRVITSTPRLPGSTPRATSSADALQPQNSSSSAPRAARPTISRAPMARRARRDVRPHALQPDRARGACGGAPAGRRPGASPGTQAGAEAIAARAVFDARRGRRARVLRAGRGDARLSEGARAHAPRAAAGRHCVRPRLAVDDRTGRRRATSAACSRASKSSSTARPSTIARRCSASPPRRAAPARCAGPSCRSCCSTCRSTRAPSGSSSAALVARSPDVLATVPDGDESRARRARWRSAAIVEARETSDVGRRTAIWRTCAATCSRSIGRRAASAAGDVSCSRRRAKDARRSRSSGACSTKRRAACRSTRWRCSCARRSSTSGCSSTPARAAACRCTSIAARGVPIRPAARSSRCCRARSKACRRSGSTSTSRSVRCRAIGATRPARRRIRSTPRRRGVRRRARALTRTDERARRGCGRVRDGGPAPPIDSDDEAIVAGTLRSPWKWEELIVESAVVGGRTRAGRQGALAAAARRPGRRLSLPDRASCGATSPSRARIARFERDLRNLAHLRAVRAADHRRRSPTGRSAATWGEWLDRLRRAGGARAATADARAADAGGSAADGRRRSGRRSRKRATCCTIGWSTLDWEPPARRYGRLFVGTPHQARGRTLPRRLRARASPSASCRSGRARIRCCSTIGAARSMPALVGQDERGARRAAAAEDRHRRGDASGCTCRIRGSTSAETRARVPSFYALDVMRAITGRVPDHRVLAAEAAEEAGASLAWPAPQRSRSRHRRPRARPRRAEAAARLARSGGGQGPRALPARPERRAAPVGHQPLGARPDTRGRRATA